MADAVQRIMERMTAPLQEMEANGIFSHVWFCGDFPKELGGDQFDYPEAQKYGIQHQQSHKVHPGLLDRHRV